MGGSNEKIFSQRGSVGRAAEVTRTDGLLFYRSQPWRWTVLTAWHKQGFGQSGLAFSSAVGCGCSSTKQVTAESDMLLKSSCENWCGILKEQAEPHLEEFRDLSIFDCSLRRRMKNRGRRERREKILSGWHRQMGRLLP